MRRMFTGVVMAMVVVSAVFAQQAPPPPKTEAGLPQAQAEIPPAVSDQDQSTFTVLQIKAQVQAEMIQSLQKELDSTNADISRLIARLQDGDKYTIQRDPQTGRLLRVTAGKK